ncbi:F-box and leucine-rich repeat protein 13 [Cricetulus griseus]
MEAKEEAPPNPRFQIPTQMTVISCEEAADLNMISVQGFRNIANSCTGIMHLTINDMPTLTDNCVKVGRNKRITDACFKYIDKNYPGINHIYMVDCKTLTDSSLKSLSVLKQLTVLNLTNCIRISDAGLRQFLDGSVSVKIRELNLNNCSLVGDPAIVKLSER